MATTTSNPVITCQRHEKGKPPKAEFACLTCEAYLCPACDGAKHKGDAKSHYRFPASQLKSYIVFDQPAKPGESHIRRNLAAPKGIVVASHHKATTCYENFQRSVRLFPDRPCLGHRTVKPDGKIGKYSFQSFKEINARVTNLGSGLKALGLQRGDKVGLYSVNRPEWVIAEQACHAYGLLPVPLYDTLGPEAAEQVIHGAGISVVVASLDKLKTLIDIHRKNIVPEFKYAVMMPLQPFDKRIDGPAPNAGGLKVLSLDECEKQGKAAGIPHDPAKPSDLCTLCYTSGTTGAPKGAMLTHTNLMSNIGACVEHGVAAYPTDVHISYLPLAHMFERIVQGLLIGSGCAIGFARGDPLLLLEDIEELKPTIFAGVPRLYNRLFDKIIGTVDQGGGIKKFLFHQGLNSKRQRLVESGQFTHGLWDRLVFGKVAARLGGRVRLMITGSAPIADPVMQFLRCAFSTYVVEGYGQTEATATVTITPMDDQKQAGNVGIPVVCSEVKLVDVPDMGYTSKDIVKGVPAPRGEIWVRGTNVFSGYYKDPERTAESLDEQGWLHSGDVGMWLPDGTLKIIDRKKNIFKLAQGEYIAPEKIENVYGRCKYVAQVFVYGDSLQSTLVAVVVPDEENLKEWHKINKIPVNGTGLQALIQHPTVNPMIMAEMAAVAKAGKLQGFEMVKAVYLHHDLFSVQNNILTPTFKLKRDYARKVFEREIAALYAKIQAQEKEKKSDSKSAL